jgi:hypothetical protein
MADAYYSGPAGTWGYTWMWSKKVFRDTLAEHTWGTYRLSKAWPQTEGELVNQLKAFQKIDYNYWDADESVSEERKITAVTDYIHWYFYAMKYHHNKDRDFQEVAKNKAPMKMLWVNASHFSKLTAKDFEDDDEKALGLSRKYAEKWLWMKTQSEGNDFFAWIPWTIDTTRNAANDTLDNNHSQAA